MALAPAVILAFLLCCSSAVAAPGPLVYELPATGPTRVTLATSGSDLQVSDDATGVVVAARPVADTTAVTIRGSDAADDTLTVDLGGASFSVPTSFDGGAGGFDTLTLTGGATTRTAHEATGPQSGTISLDDLVLRYAEIEPVNDTVPATNFTFNAPAAAARVGLVDGPGVSGFDTMQINDGGTGAFELINFANKTNVTINAGTSSAVTVDVGRNAAGASSLAVNAGAGPSSFDLRNAPLPMTVTGSPAADTFLLRGTLAGASPTLNGAEGSDRYFVSFGGLRAPASIADVGGGVDELSVLCGPPITITASAVSSGGESVSYSGIEVPPAACPSQGATGPQGAQGAAGPVGARGPVPLVAALLTTKATAKRGRAVRVDYLATASGTARLDVLKGAKRVARITGAFKLGRNRLTWNGKAGTKRAAAGRYRLVLVLRTSDGQTVTESGQVTVRR
jgi:hypothetical protein